MGWGSAAWLRFVDGVGTIIYYLCCAHYVLMYKQNMDSPGTYSHSEHPTTQTNQIRVQQGSEDTVIKDMHGAFRFQIISNFERPITFLDTL